MLLIEIHEPPAPVHVGLVLPHGFDAVLEDAVVAAGDEVRRELDVVVHSPKVLYGVESHHLQKRGKQK